MDEFMYEIRCFNGQIPLVPFHLSTTHLRFEGFFDRDFVRFQLRIRLQEKLGAWAFLLYSEEGIIFMSMNLAVPHVLFFFVFSPSKCTSNRAAAYCMDGVFFILSDLQTLT